MSARDAILAREAAKKAPRPEAPKSKRKSVDEANRALETKLAVQAMLDRDAKRLRESIAEPPGESGDGS